MGNAFTSSDWAMVQTNASTTAAQLRAKGAAVGDFTRLPPVPESQLVDFTRETGLAFPSDFADLVTKFAGGWKFDWCLHVKKTDRWLKPPAFVSNFGGNSEVPFIGATAAETLLDRYWAFQARIHSTYLDDPDTLKVMPALFPLHSWDGGGGDYTVLRLDVSPSRIYYLDHEAEWAVNAVIGEGFREFVLDWASLGFPECAYYRAWLNARTQEPIESRLKAERWRKWLADPHAT